MTVYKIRVAGLLKQCFCNILHCRLETHDGDTFLTHVLGSVSYLLCEDELFCGSAGFIVQTSDN